ncbi:MAG: PD40 domain-containing protein [Opitutaceae bacterium]|nr:PD40 domain-containing protein [Opitutaceae bacterium]
MNSVPFAIVSVGLYSVLALSAFAQAKVESVVILPQGQNFASHGANAVSQPGLHVLIPSPKGSRRVYLHDGVEGQRFDQVTDPSHKALSSDGKRHAYTVFVGTDVILVLDGKEIARAPANDSLNPFPSPLFGFSPSGKRFWYVTPAEPGGVHKLVVDGVASDPTNGITLAPVFSPDESRYVAMFTKHDERRGSLLMVDGRNVGFQGDRPQFSPDGKNVLTIGHLPDTDVLLINGKQASRAPLIHSVHMSSGGLNFLVLSGSRGTPGVFLGSGGKKIPGSDCDSIDKVIFSPDGKRYAALCTAGGSRKFVLIDGRKGQLYDQVEGLQFTADSAKALYLARSYSAGGQFLLVEDEESDGYQGIQLVLGAGKRIGYIAQVMGQPNASVVVDGKATLVRGASYLGFSPDGSHYGFNGFVGGFLSLYLDGVEQKGVNVYETNFIDGQDKPRFRFSPDGKYVAHFGSVNGDAGKRGLVVNGRLVDPMTALYSLPFFTPDGNHIIYFRFIAGGGYEVMVDGRPVEKITSIPNLTMPFEMGADGVFTFIGIADGAAKRFRIMPDGSTSIASMLAAKG